MSKRKTIALATLICAGLLAAFVLRSMLFLSPGKRREGTPAVDIPPATRVVNSSAGGMGLQAGALLQLPDGGIPIERLAEQNLHMLEEKIDRWLDRVTVACQPAVLPLDDIREIDEAVARRLADSSLKQMSGQITPEENLKFISDQTELSRRQISARVANLDLTPGCRRAIGVVQ